MTATSLNIHAGDSSLVEPHGLCLLRPPFFGGEGGQLLFLEGIGPPQFWTTAKGRAVASSIDKQEHRNGHFVRTSDMTPGGCIQKIQFESIGFRWKAHPIPVAAARMERHVRNISTKQKHKRIWCNLTGNNPTTTGTTIATETDRFYLSH